jgi:SAM-dependent methyltransferase
MRVRLRDAHPDEAAFYTGRYPTGYHHGHWPDHVERIKATADFAAPWVRHFPITSVADLSCGDGALVRSLVGRFPTRPWRTYVGDLNPLSSMVMRDEDGVLLNGTHTTVPGALPDSLDTFRWNNQVDLYVCSETLEHLDDPDLLLSKARTRAKYLLLTTPDGETPAPDGGGNLEHYWGWDTEAISVMLHVSGWKVTDHVVFTPSSADVYRFQMWFCH